MHNVRGIVGIHDPQAVFVAVSLSKVESVAADFHYASGDLMVVSEHYPKHLEEGAEAIVSRKPMTVMPEEGKTKYFVTSIKVDLTKWRHRGMDEPGILFFALCTEFGQGMQL